MEDDKFSSIVSDTLKLVLAFQKKHPGKRIAITRSSTSPIGDTEIVIATPEEQASWQKMLEEIKANKVAQLIKSLETIIALASWHADMNADPDNESPEDSVAHVNGLIIHECTSAIAKAKGNNNG